MILGNQATTGSELRGLLFISPGVLSFIPCSLSEAILLREEDLLSLRAFGKVEISRSTYAAKTCDVFL